MSAVRKPRTAAQAAFDAMSDEIVEETLCGVTIRRRVLPHRIRDPHGFFTDTARWMVQFEKKVGLPMAAAMQEKIDRMWGDDATAGR